MAYRFAVLLRQNFRNGRMFAMFSREPWLQGGHSAP